MIMGAGVEPHYPPTNVPAFWRSRKCGTQGRNGGGWAPSMVGEDPPDHGLGLLHLRLDWARPPTPDDLTGWYYMTTDQWRYAVLHGLGRQETRSSPRTWTASSWSTPQVGSARLDALLPDVLQGLDRKLGRGPAEPTWLRRSTSQELRRGCLQDSRSRTDAHHNVPKSSRTGAQPARLVRGYQSSSCATCWAPATRSAPRSWQRATAPRPSTGVTLTPVSSTSCGSRTSMATSTTLHSDVVLPAAVVRSTTCPPRTCTPSCTASTGREPAGGARLQFPDTALPRRPQPPAPGRRRTSSRFPLGHDSPDAMTMADIVPERTWTPGKTMRSWCDRARLHAGRLPKYDRIGPLCPRLAWPPRVWRTTCRRGVRAARRPQRPTRPHGRQRRRGHAVRPPPSRRRTWRFFSGATNGSLAVGTPHAGKRRQRDGVLAEGDEEKVPTRTPCTAARHPPAPVVRAPSTADRNAFVQSVECRKPWHTLTQSPAVPSTTTG